MTKNETKNETKKDNNNDFMMSLKSNEPLKKILFLAKNLSNNLSNLVPKMGKSVFDVITEIDKRQDIKIKGQIDPVFLRNHLYTLASYDSKTKDRAFELAVTRSIRWGIKAYQNPTHYKFDKDEIFVMSKVAVPFKTEELKGLKGGVKKVVNTDETLEPVRISLIDKIWANTMAVNKRQSKTKDTKINFQQLSSNFLNELESVWKLADKKDYNKLLEIVDEKTIENLGNISALLTDNSIRSAWIKASDNLSVSGDVKKSA